MPRPARRVVEAHGARQRIGRHHLLDAAHHEIDDHALEAEQSPMLPTMTCLTAVLAITCCTVVAKFSSTMMALAPESLSWCSSSRGV
jgi:hypothetical protein